MKAALYARISINEQPKESIDDQLRECRELCRRHDFSIVDEYSDRGQSGNEVNRPAYQRLLRVSSPGSDWHRTKRRRHGKWLASAIHGDPKRGSGILNNELYVGRYIWNRRQSRKKLRSGDREFLLRPPEDWIATSHPELCIVSENVWQKVKARQRERAAHIGARVRRGLSRHQAYATGAYPKYLLSGLLQCGLCGEQPDRVRSRTRVRLRHSRQRRFARLLEQIALATRTPGTPPAEMDP